MRHDPMDAPDEAAMSQCSATSRQSGARCRRHAALGRAVCVMHGGASLAGAASPSLRSGRYSKYLPVRLLARYQEAERDSELLALRDEIALIDTRLVDVLGRVETGESSSLWHQLHAAYKRMQMAHRSGDPDGLRLALVELGDLIQRGHGDWAAWADVRSLIRDRQRLVESERKRLVQMQQMLSATEAMTLVTAISDAVKRHVHDPEALRAISAEVAQLVSQDGATT